MVQIILYHFSLTISLKNSSSITIFASTLIQGLPYHLGPLLAEGPKDGTKIDFIYIYTHTYIGDIKKIISFTLFFHFQYAPKN